MEQINYQDIKNNIRGQLNSVAESFVFIGYQLKQVRDRELYLEDGYKDIYEFAQSEYNLSKSNVSRFMAINDKFSVEGNSTSLLEEYKDYGSSKLAEMLTLDEEELNLISQRTTVKEIRELKQIRQENEIFAMSQQNPQNLDYTQSNLTSSNDILHLKNIIIDYFNKESQKDKLVELIKQSKQSTLDNLSISKLFNPSGHFTYKKDIEMAFFEEEVIKYKKFGNPTLEYSYVDLLDIIYNTYDTDSNNPWESFYREDSNIPGQQDIDNNYPEYKPETTIQENVSEFDDKKPEVGTIIYSVNGVGNIKSYEVVSKHCKLSEKYFSAIDKNGAMCHISVKDEHWHYSREDAKRDSWYEEKEQKKSNNVTKPTEVNEVEEEESEILDNEVVITESGNEIIDYENDVESNVDDDKNILPILKNNEQRGIFIDSYETWNLWIETKETGEKYYRFDLSDSTSIVVKVYHAMLFDYKSYATKYEDRYKEGYGKHEYYLLEDEKFFKDCETNKSALIEKLKDIQRKGE